MNNDQIDWNNAPEGATHWCANTKLWYKVTDGRGVYKNYDDGAWWQDSIMTAEEINMLTCFIPRPVTTEIKQPLGLCPKNMFIEQMNKQRKNDIEQAIVRYVEARKGVPNEWLQELIELNNVLVDEEETGSIVEIQAANISVDNGGWIVWGKVYAAPDIPCDTWLEKEYSDGQVLKGPNSMYAWFGGGQCGTPRYYVTRYRYIDKSQEENEE